MYFFTYTVFQIIYKIIIFQKYYKIIILFLLVPVEVVCNVGSCRG